MKYAIPQEVIPFEKRAEINSKVLLLIESGQLGEISAEDIFGAYTGEGGLHGLVRNEFSSFYSYTKAKKEIEQGQFFTPAQVCEQIVKSLPISQGDLVADLTCGMGNFFNFLPVESNAYGCELDFKAAKVASFLYPKATIHKGDLRFYSPGISFDHIIGNPPFNLRWDYQGESQASHWVYLQKCKELINPGGFVVAIVPEAFLSDEFMDGNKIEWLNESFYFIAQCKLKANSFQSLGVKSFPTKVLFLQRAIEGVSGSAFQVDSSVELGSSAFTDLLQQASRLRATNQVRIRGAVSMKSESNNYSVKNSAQRQGNGYEFLLKKLLFEIHTHPQSRLDYSRAQQVVRKYETQVMPDGMKPEEWEKVRVTEGKVLASLRRILRDRLNPKVSRTGIKLERVAGGFMFRTFDAESRRELNEAGGPAFISFNDIFSGRVSLKNPLITAHFRRFEKLINRKQSFYRAQTRDLSTLGREESLDKKLSAFRFKGADGKEYGLNSIQRKDVGIILQQPAGGILNWEQGGGKSIGALAAYSILNTGYHNTFLVAPPIAISMTWEPMLKLQGISFRVLTSLLQVEEIQKGELVLIPLTQVYPMRRQLKRYLRTIKQNAFLIFDESDEISNYSSKRSRAMRVCFSKVKRTLLTTGTITRNNLSEMYGQLELILNNSSCFEDTCLNRYKENKTETGLEITRIPNEHYGRPFVGRKGYSYFKSCFSPTKSTVFGIGKHNQDIYNPGSLDQLIRSTVVTRKFRDIVGPDKYSIHTHTFSMEAWEEEFYERVLGEFQSMMPHYFASTGNSRKDSMLRIIRQLKLLIQSCSVPHLLSGQNEVPTKAMFMQAKLEAIPGKKILIGCTSKKAARFYHAWLPNEFPGRPVFIVTGENSSFKKRQVIIDEFAATANGILVCTQQSLSSSVSLPFVEEVFMESLQWSIPRCAQFYFRAIRFNSPHKVNVHFFLYKDSIEINMMTLLMDKERMNDYIKTLEFRSLDKVMGDFQLSVNFLDMLIEKVKDENGNTQVKWGKQKLVA